MAVRDVVQAAAGQGGDKLYVEDVFSTYLYTGTGAAQTITNGIDLAGEGGLVWTKIRELNGGAEDHFLADTDSPAPANPLYFVKTLTSNSTGAYAEPYRSITGWNSNGYGVERNLSFGGLNYKYASWTFRKAPKFFDVVTYTGDGVAGRTVAHNLGSVPGCILFKRTDGGATNWRVYHRSLGATKTLKLNTTDAEQVFSNVLNDTDPTSTVFTVGNFGDVNGLGSTYVAYLFAHDAGGFGEEEDQNIISCGSYTGNGSSTGPVINLGWEPQFVLIKSTSITGNWWIVDSMRKMSLADFSNGIKPNSSAVEDMYFYLYPNATGFSPASTSAEINQSGATYIYMAIRRPMKSFDSGTDVFAIDFQGTGGVLPGYKAPFPVDTGMWKDRDGGGTQLSTRIAADALLDTTNTNAEAKPARSYSFDYQNGWFDASAVDTTRVGWMFRRAPGFHDVVGYTGTGNTGTGLIPHNLTVAPELVIIKPRSSGAWECGTQFTATQYVYLVLNSTNAWGPKNYNSGYGDYSAPPTDTLVKVLPNGSYNSNGINYIAYLFSSLDGVSKVGTYSGTGADLNVDCGFSAGARFILIKRTDASGDWYVWDSARGIAAGNDPYLLLNSTAAEVTSTDYIDPLASGFTVTSSAPAALNASGGSYIFLAIA